VPPLVVMIEGVFDETPLVIGVIQIRCRVKTEACDIEPRDGVAEEIDDGNEAAVRAADVGAKALFDGKRDRPEAYIAAAQPAQ